MVLEPKSGLITDPVCVFDFQSLYPSLIIGYNMCYSTCLGRLSDPNPVVQLGTQPGLVRHGKHLGKSIAVCSDVLFAQRSDRVGLIPRICHEILQTRIMVKKSMKVGNKSPGLLKQLDARQLSLKLLANVIYGYTTASFSGRMPCAEIADSIVLTGRQSLESVMRLAEEMGGEIVYGDTDSLFVKLAGKSVGEAFEFGTRLVDKVANLHPWPMKLIHEKVYWPCCLVTKKRYVGRAFDTINSEPRLDAKGIETIRRDTCPAVAVTVERILQAVFKSVESDICIDPAIILESACITEFSRLLKGGLPIKFFIFQNQVRELSQYKSNLPPAARVAANAGRGDSVMKGERIAYVITNGLLGSKLADLVMEPKSLIEKKTLNFDYYLTKQVIPAIQRIFGPLGNRAHSWLSEARNLTRRNASIDQIKRCLLCQSTIASSIFKNAVIPSFCNHCLRNRETQTIATKLGALRKAEMEMSECWKICLHWCWGRCY